MGAAIAAALLSFSLATPALADGRGWRGDDDRRGHRDHRHGDHRDHDRDRQWDRRHGDHDWDRRGHRWHGGRAYYGRDHGRGYEYGCRRHGKRWRDQGRFHHHLTSDHRVPYYAIPQAVVFAGWGWDYRH
jgi:hypothetical protein